MSPKYSIVVPVYNSANTLAELYQRTSATLSSEGFEIIFVDDASSDNSWEVLTQLKEQHPKQVTAIRLQKNAGQHLALMCGFSFCKGQFVVTLDDDLQIAPEDIPLLAQKQAQTEAELVYGTFADKQHHPVRNAGSKFIEKLTRRYASTPGRGSSFKLISRSLIDKIRTLNISYVYIDELLSWYTKDIAFAEVSHHPRKEGKSGYSFFKLLSLAVNIIITYTVLPLRIITWLGLLMAVVFFGVGVYFIVTKYTVGAELGFTALITAIFFSAGLILFSLGIIGEYISRLFAIQSKKPQFSIKEIL